jgi:hypothetical protein
VFRPNQDCIVYNVDGAHDVFGKPLPPTIKARERCAIVTLITRQQITSVRADSSGSRGAADEQVATSRFLFTKNTAVDLDDLIEVAGIKLRVSGKFPRHALTGRLDHFEIEAVIWSKQ